MTLNIISAEKVEFTGEVSKVTMPGALGLFTVLENHAALISSLVAGRWCILLMARTRKWRLRAVLPTLIIMLFQCVCIKSVEYEESTDHINVSDDAMCSEPSGSCSK